MPNLMDLQLKGMENVVEQAVGPLRTAIPAIVSSYDHATQTATLQLAVNGKKKVRNAQRDVEEVPRTPPLIPGVPVAFFATGSAAITRKLVPGDVGLAIFCDQALNEWKATGGRGKAGINPQHVRRFDISDAIFLPGVRPKADTLPADALAEEALVIYDENEIRLGSANASDYVALASLVQAELAAFKANLEAALDAGVLAAVPSDGGKFALGAVKTALTYTPSSVGATKVKAE